MLCSVDLKTKRVEELEPLIGQSKKNHQLKLDRVAIRSHVGRGQPHVVYVIVNRLTHCLDCPVPDPALICTRHNANCGNRGRSYMESLKDKRKEKKGKEKKKDHQVQPFNVHNTALKIEGSFKFRRESVKQNYKQNYILLSDSAIKGLVWNLFATSVEL